MIRHFCVFLLLLGSFVSCQKKEKGAGHQVVGVNFTYSPLSVDPRKGTDPVTTTLNFMLYEGLTRLEPDGTVSMALAERVKISKDKKKYLFYLRECMWSDGSPLTAYHFETSWKKALDPEFPSKAAHLLFPIKNGEEAKRGKCSLDEVGVEAIDERTLLVRLKRPTPYFLELTSFCTYFPVPYNGDEVPHPQQSLELLSSGPFSLASWKNNDEIVVVKNPYYWNAEKVKLEEISISMVSDEVTALNLFEQGKLDYIGGLVSPLPIDGVASLKGSPSLKQRPIAGTNFCAFNVHRYPFNNLHIRKAFAYAVNRKEITESISQMFDDVASGPVPLILKSVASTLFEDHQKKLAQHHFELGLQELGITKEEFPVVTNHYFSSELQKNIALTLQSYWKETLGVTVKLQASELKSHLAKLHAKDFSLAQMSWIGQYHDRMNFLERFDGKDAFRNYTGWENPHFTRLLAESFSHERKKRELLLEQAEELLIEEMPIIPLYHYHSVYLKNPRLHDLATSPMGDIQFHKAYLTD